MDINNNSALELISHINTPKEEACLLLIDLLTINTIRDQESNFIDSIIKESQLSIKEISNNLYDYAMIVKGLELNLELPKAQLYAILLSKLKKIYERSEILNY